jgi:transposase InsO family protein
MTDNGSCYRSHRFASACRRLGLRHLRTRPYRPCTNGKAERFIQTLLRGWAYHRPYPTSAQRTQRLPKFLSYYNQRRPHASLSRQTPASRLREQRPEN